ncbi:MAG: flippase-like domain-containing protein [Saprospiraceae bacterium]|nr:flippase-like domain-containing protein [Saprospiraceae bacterium]
MKKSLFFSILKYLIFVSFGGGLFYYVFHSQEEVYRIQCMQDPALGGNCSLWSKLLHDIRHLNWFLISLVMLGFILSNLMRARRWVIMLKPLGIHSGLWETYWAVHLGYFANLALPRMGEIARGGALAKRLKAPLEKVLGTIISDRLLDMLVLSIFTAIAFSLQTQILYNFLSKKASISIWHLMIVGILGIVGIGFIVYLFRTDRVYHPVIEKLKNRLTGFIAGILSLGKNERPLEMVALSLGIWIMYFAMTVIGLKAFEPTSKVTLVQGFIVFIIGSLGMIIPTPGGMGPFHVLTMSALGIYGISSIDGFSYANLSFFIIQIVTISVFGLIGMFYLAKNKHKPTLG